MSGKKGGLTICVIFAVGLCACNNFFHDLIPPDDNLITRFEIDGQIGAARIGQNTVNVTVAKGTDLGAVIPRISVSEKASLLPMTMDYVRAAFPGVDFLKTAMQMHTTADFTQYASDLIRENPHFNVPALTLTMDFTGPVTLAVISGQGSMRQYTVNVEIDSGEPRLLGFSFAKYDNPELVSDSRSVINETSLTVTGTAVYPMEMDDLSYALIPSFEIMGERLEIDGVEIDNGETEVQFDKVLGAQTKTITVWREGASKDYALTVTFTEDPDTIRSITDFRFYKTNNSNIAANAVASIVNTENTGTITVQVFYSGEKPSTLIPGFITPGTASVAGITQISRVNTQDFSAPLEYRVVSRNGLYVRTYTVKVEFISLVSGAPRITSFRFNQSLNHDLVQDTAAVISDGLIMIDVYYGGAYAPDTLIPEFTAQGIVTVLGSVQISGSSAQFFNRQIKYTVTNPENPVLTRDYWVQTRMTRDTSSDAKITAFGFYPEDNPGLEDPVIGKIDQGTGKISVFAPVGSGVTARTMYPRFEAVGQVSVGGVIQSSRSSPRIFDAPVTYTVTSANGKNSKNYEVTVRELRSTIFVNPNASGYSDGTSWENAFLNLQAACSAAALFPDDIPKEIWIAAGTYKPGANTEDYFRLTPSTSYIGGFAGNETAKSQRNLAANKVTISGDLGGGQYSNNLFGSFNGALAQAINGDLAFEDLTLENAKATLPGNRSNGGAINAVLSDGMELRINRCNFSDLEALDYGGAVFVGNGRGSAEIVDTIIENVQAANGGAVCSDAIALTISNLSIANVRSSSDTNTGGIYSSGGALTVDGLTLRDITGRGIYQVNGGNISLSGIDASGISGDAVYCTGISIGQVRLDGNSTFNNTGRVYISSSVPVRVTDTEIRNNSGDNALYVDSASAATIIERVTIDEVPNGRGIYVSTNNSLITDSIIKSCTTTGNGGGINFNGSGNTAISGVTIENVQAANGGGIYLGGSGNYEISGVTIENVEAFNGGAVYSSSASALTISNMSITNARSSTSTNNSVIYNIGGALTVDGLTLRDSTGTGIYKERGGGISLSGIDTSGISGKVIFCTDLSSGPLSLRNSKFDNPGSVYISFSTTEITDPTDDNVLYVSSGNVPITIDNVIIDGSSNSRGIWASSTDSVLINESQIKNCTATDNGGGIYFDGPAEAVISDTTIEDVTAGYNGGGIYITDAESTLTISNTIIRRAKAAHYGGAVCFMGRSTVIADSVIEDVETGDIYSGAVDFTFTTPPLGLAGSLTIDGLNLRNIIGRGILTWRVDCSFSRIDADGINDFAVSTQGISNSLILQNSKFNNTSGVRLVGGSGVSVQVRDTEIYNSNFDALYVQSSSAHATIERVFIDGVQNGRGIGVSADTALITDSTIKNCSAPSSGGGGGGIWMSGNKLIVRDCRIENCRAERDSGAISVTSNINVSDLGVHEIYSTVFLNCAGENDINILRSDRFSIIRDCTFTQDNDFVYLTTKSGTNSINDFSTVFGRGGNFENCTFTNLKGNMEGENYLFTRQTSASTIQLQNSSLTLKNCTFYFNPGSAGLCNLYSGSSTNTRADNLLMDGVRIYDNGGQKPLISLNNNNTPGTFQFKLNNYYNETLLDNELAIAGLAFTGVVRLTNNATPVFVP